MANSNKQAAGPSHRVARAEAAAWIVRLHGPQRTADLEAGFRAWLVADPENSRQFERVTEVWDAARTPVPGVARLGHWDGRTMVRGRTRWALAAAVGSMAIGIAAWGINSFWLNPSYSTGIGEQRIVRLTDGSRLTLNANTRVAVAYREQDRTVRIEHGEAYFEVTANPLRPFRVHAGAHRVEVLGTSFVVRYDADKTAVTLVEGKVAVSAQNDNAPEFHDVLTPGQRLTLATRMPPTLDTPRIDAITGWRRGEVMLDRTALAEAVAEMNRYDEMKLVIDEPGIAALQVSGIYHTGDSETFAKTVARLYGLAARHEGNRIHLARKAGETQAPN